MCCVFSGACLIVRAYVARLFWSRDTWNFKGLASSPLPIEPPETFLSCTFLRTAILHFWIPDLAEKARHRSFSRYTTRRHCMPIVALNLWACRRKQSRVLTFISAKVFNLSVSEHVLISGRKKCSRQVAKLLYCPFSDKFARNFYK